MKGRPPVLAALTMIPFLLYGRTAAAQQRQVSVQNFITSSEDVDQPDVRVRVVMVHLETNRSVIVDVGPGQKKSVGTLIGGPWAVVITRKIGNETHYVAGGVAAVNFPRTLVALYNTGVVSASD